MRILQKNACSSLLDWCWIFFNKEQSVVLYILLINLKMIVFLYILTAVDLFGIIVGVWVEVSLCTMSLRIIVKMKRLMAFS